MAAHPEALVFGQDVAVKGGVYGVTRGLHKRFGGRPRLRHPARRADDPRHRARDRPGRLPAGPGDPVPRLPAQRRGPAARRGGVPAPSSPTGSTATGWWSGSPGSPTRGVRRPLPQRQLAGRAARHPRAGARGRRATRPTRPALLRGCFDLARRDGRVCVFVEPIASYHTRDLLEDGDGGWTAPYAADGDRPLGSVARHGDGGDAAPRHLRQRGLPEPPGGRHPGRRRHRRHRAGPARGWRRCPSRRSCAAAGGFGAVLVVDETRHSGGVSEGVVATAGRPRVRRTAGPRDQRRQLRPARPGRGDRAARRGRHRRSAARALLRR